MRNLLLCLLLATTAAPALAQSEPSERQSRREAREARDAERAQRQAERAADAPAPRERVERRVRDVDPAVEQRSPDRPVDVDDAPDPRPRRAPARDVQVVEAEGPRGDDRPGRRVRRPDGPRTTDAPTGDSVADWRRERRDEIRDRDGVRVARTPLQPRVRPPREARPDRPAPPPATVGVASHRTPRWASSWRGDRRYDWRRHRDRNRSLFRIGLYFDPFGWNYRHFGIGWRLWPSYYSRSYWLDDPYMYRLPYAPHPYRWIRYWDDALLVNMYTGQVVDVERNFFW